MYKPNKDIYWKQGYYLLLHTWIVLDFVSKLFKILKIATKKKSQFFDLKKKNQQPWNLWLFYECSFENFDQMLMAFYIVNYFYVIDS